MRKFIIICGLLRLIMLARSYPGESFKNAYNYMVPSDFSDELPQQRLFNVPYGRNEKYVLRNVEENRPEIDDYRPLCEEERKSHSIRDLINSPTSNFLQTSDGVDFSKFNLVPRKVDIIKCMSGTEESESRAICKPENCKERKVDVQVFGRLKNDTENIWKFLGTLSAVPVACECFVRWKPEKCSRSIDIFSEV